MRPLSREKSKTDKAWTTPDSGLNHNLNSDTTTDFTLRYKIDLKTFMAQCEANYLRICKLLPAKQAVDSSTRSLRMAGFGDQLFYIQLVERTPYTWLVELGQQPREDSPGPRWVQMPRLKVRLYHDAKLAEVLSFEGVRKVWPRHSYPNQHMYQPDEKAQWNQFLEDWLRMIDSHGYEASVACEFGTL